MAGKRMLYVSGVVVLVAVAYFGWKLTARSAYESAEYTLLESDGQFEIREYADLMMATTNMRFESQADDGSFMRLFRYISGVNNGERKVAMTTPVFMEPDSDESQGQMGFVIPKKVTDQNIPAPSDDQVQIKKREGGQFAVIRFAGRIDSESVKKAERKLRKWMAEKDLVSDGDDEYAGYDPPWTPSPLRRNEILFRLK
jgi:hypothetical protein